MKRLAVVFVVIALVASLTWFFVDSSPLPWTDPSEASTGTTNTVGRGRIAEDRATRDPKKGRQAILEAERTEESGDGALVHVRVLRESDPPELSEMTVWETVDAGCRLRARDS